MSLGLWVTVILFASLAMLWGVIGIVFSLINTVIVPYETLTGPIGLYLWSCLSGIDIFLKQIIVKSFLITKVFIYSSLHIYFYDHFCCSIFWRNSPKRFIAGPNFRRMDFRRFSMVIWSNF